MGGLVAGENPDLHFRVPTYNQYLNYIAISLMAQVPDLNSRSHPDILTIALSLNRPAPSWQLHLSEWLPLFFEK